MTAVPPQHRAPLPLRWVDLRDPDWAPPSASRLARLGTGAGQRASALGTGESARGFLRARDELLRWAEGRLGAASGALRLAFECPRCGDGAHGRPRILRAAAGGDTVVAEASLSRAGGRAVLVLAAPGQAVGIDLVDTRDAAFDPGEPGYVGTPEHWAALEAEGKAVGVGLADWTPGRRPGDGEEPRWLQAWQGRIGDHLVALCWAARGAL